MTESYVTFSTRTFRVTDVREPMAATPLLDAVTAVAVARTIYAMECDANVEQFMVLGLNARGQLVGYKIVGKGTATTCLVHPREVFHAAITLGATTIIAVHNHPSGSLEPSSNDDELTARILDCGKLMGIPMIDHLLITTNGGRSIMLRNAA